MYHIYMIYVYIYMCVCVCVYIYIYIYIYVYICVPDSSVGKESTCNAGDPGSVSGSGRFPGEGKDYPLHMCVKC